MIDISFLNSLSRLKLAMKYKSSMSMSGNRKSIQKGNSTEFSGFREYAHGDDPRRIDWNAFARLNKLYIKEYMEEKESTVRILIDTSSSMNYGSNSKSLLAVKLSLAIAYIAINNLDRVILYDLNHIESPYKCTSGKNSIPGLVNWLDNLHFDGTKKLTDIIYSLAPIGNGITILISDLLNEDIIDTPEVFEKMIKYFIYQKHNINILHVLSQEELNVNFEGTLNLIDMEDNSKIKVSMENKSIKNYEKLLTDFINSVQNITVKNQGQYSLCDTGLSFEQIIFEKLRFMYDI